MSCRRLLKRKSRKMAKPPKRMGSSEWMLYKGVAAGVSRVYVQKKAINPVMSRLEHLDKGPPGRTAQVSMRLPDAGRTGKNAAAIRHLTVVF